MKVLKLKPSLFNWLSLMPLFMLSIVLVLSVFSASYHGQTLKECSGGNCSSSSISLTKDYGCGSTGVGSADVPTSIDFGCYGDSCANGIKTGYCSAQHNGITDLLFAVIRFLSDGVGLVVVASVIIGGIQYITSRGDPNATQGAIKRLTSSLLALLIFIFAYAIINFVVPTGFFGQ